MPRDEVAREPPLHGESNGRATDKPYRHARWLNHFDEIDREIAQLAVVCQIPLLDPGVIERVLHKDTLVCGRKNARAFDKLRSLLMMHYSVARRPSSRSARWRRCRSSTRSSNACAHASATSSAARRPDPLGLTELCRL